MYNMSLSKHNTHTHTHCHYKPKWKSVTKSNQLSDYMIQKIKQITTFTGIKGMTLNTSIIELQYNLQGKDTYRENVVCPL